MLKSAGSQGDLSVSTLRTLRSILPSSCVWTALRPKDTCTAEQTIDLLVDFFPPKEDAPVNANGDDKRLHGLPEALNGALDQPLVLASLGGMIAFVGQLPSRLTASADSEGGHRLAVT
jgi:DNA mismatch repair protein MSH6